MVRSEGDGVFERTDRRLMAWHVLAAWVVAVALGAVLALVTGPHLTELLPEGTTLLDWTFAGYGHAEVEAFREALTHEDLVYYASWHLIIDIPFAVAAFAALAGLFLLVTRPGVRFSVPLPEGIRLVVVALAGSAAVADIIENFALWFTLAPEHAPSGALELAALLTTVKAMAYVAALIGVVAAVLLAAIRGATGREAARA